jgi:hypothetical protein
LERKDAISLLVKIMATCESFYKAQSVAITLDYQTKKYVLSVTWAPTSLENKLLTEILEDRDLVMETKNGRIVFRSLPKPG